MLVHGIMQAAVMSRRNLLDLLQGQTLAPCIHRMRLDSDVGLLEPAMQGLAVNAELATTVSQRNKSHNGAPDQSNDETEQGLKAMR